MSENRVVLTDNTEFLPQDDKRAENIRLAMRLFVRELKSLNLEDVDRVMKRWSVAEIEMGDSIRLGISFPDDLERYQWFRTEGFELRKVAAQVVRSPGVKNAKVRKS